MYMYMFDDGLCHKLVNVHVIMSNHVYKMMEFHVIMLHLCTFNTIVFLSINGYIYIYMCLSYIIALYQNK